MSRQGEDASTRVGDTVSTEHINQVHATCDNGTDLTAPDPTETNLTFGKISLNSEDFIGTMNMDIEKPASTKEPPKIKHILREKFVLKNSDVKVENNEEVLKNELDVALKFKELPSMEDQKTENKNHEGLNLTEEELENLKQCRLRAYGKVNLKKRLHLNPSLPQYFLKEWQVIYPESSLTSKDLMSAYDTLDAKDDSRRSSRTRKRKRCSPTPRASANEEVAPKLKSQPPEKKCKIKDTKKSDPIGDDETVPCALPGDIISSSDHSDKQWSPAMLANLLYANNEALTKGTTLEMEWKAMYPNSGLTARNLKSRHTVYSRNRSEQSVLKSPMMEVEPVLVTPKLIKAEPSDKVLAPTSTKPKILKPEVENPKSIKRENEQNENIPQNTFKNCDKTKSTSKGKSVKNYLKNSSSAEGELNQDEVSKDSETSANENAIDDDSLSSSGSSDSWTVEMLENLHKAKIFVEDRLRCVRDDYFYELLHERWIKINPDSKDTIEDVKTALVNFEKDGSETTPLLKTEIKCEESEENSNDIIDSIPSMEVKEEHKIDEELLNDYIKEESKEFDIKEEPIDFCDLPKSKWVCDDHYIHVFYDDEDRSVECILTDQLLQMRASLAPHFAGLDLTRPGKKPAGFARMLLAEWKRHYPASEENTKTISMKIGRYDRAPQQLQTQGDKTKGGRNNWTPAMLENIRLTRERAVVEAGLAGGQALTKRWRAEWDAVYPDLRIDWKQVVSRYHYHYGSERRESGEMPSHRNSTESEKSTSESPEETSAEDIRGFRQWTPAMQELLLDLREQITADNPQLPQDDKRFSQHLLAAFQEKQPQCMESARSLLCKLRDATATAGKLLVEKQKTPEQEKNPAEDLMSHIEGFSDWNLGKVRDFIGCMDKARRKYSSMKETEPGMKLVPLLLAEWKILYPQSVETVKTFLVRIRYLKTNKEPIKTKLGEFDLLPRMDEVKDKDDLVYAEEIKFEWESSLMMPDVIATRGKAIAKQKKELAQGRRVSYAKIWIKEFKKLYPNCPYTANNLSVHYWYWTSKDAKDGTVMKPREFDLEGDETEIEEIGGWTKDKLEELKKVGEKVQRMLKDSSVSNNTKTLGYNKLLLTIWCKVHPDCTEKERSLATILFNYEKRLKAGKYGGIRSRQIEKNKASSCLSNKEMWTPRHNRSLRQLVIELKKGKCYIEGELLAEWEKLYPGNIKDWESLKRRLIDCNLRLPKKGARIVKMIKPSVEKIESINEDVVPLSLPVHVKAKQPVVIEEGGSGLNSRGQMRWSRQAVTDLLESHKMGLEAKNGNADKRLADLVHAEFLRRHPYCPIAPPVLLTKCYIFRSELKSGKLVLGDDSSDDTGERYRSLQGLRSWSKEMLDELGISRKRAIAWKRMAGPEAKGIHLADIWLQEFKNKFPDYKSSRKNLFRKYKWWKSKQQIVGAAPKPPSSDLKIQPEVSKEVFLEIKAILESSQIVLPPFVSSKLIMVAQQWAWQESDRMCEVRHEAQGGLLRSRLNRKTPSPPNHRLPQLTPRPQYRQPHAVHNADATSVQAQVLDIMPGPPPLTMGHIPTTVNHHQNGLTPVPDPTTFKLPGGAMLVAMVKSGQSKNKPRHQEAPNVSITLSQPKHKGLGGLDNLEPLEIVQTDSVHSEPQVLATPPCPAPVITRLQELGLSLPHLPTVLAVYKESRERYRDLVREDYVLSWSRLLHHRWRDSSSIAVTPSQLDCLVQLLLEETQNRNPLKTLLRPSPPQQVTESLVTSVAECRGEVLKGRGKGGETVRRGWMAWKEKHGSMLTIRQFVSMLDLVGSDRSIEETVVDCELVEVWDAMGGNKWEKEGEKEEVIPVKEEKVEEVCVEIEDPFNLEVISQQYRKTRNITGCPVNLTRKRASNPRLYWSYKRLDSLRLAARKSRDRWGRYNREQRRRWSLLKLLQKEFKNIEPSCVLNQSEIAGKLVMVERTSKRKLAGKEKRDIDKMAKEYLEFLDTETDVETIKAVEEVTLEAEDSDEETDIVDYNNDEVVLKYIREKEGNKKTQHSLVWNYTAIGQLLEARKLGKKRREQWEEWAVWKHGTLEAAYSNPRVKAPKMDELLVEEWGKVRPNQADLSAWTLTSYLKKFDNLKQTLLEEQETEKRKKREAISVTEYFPGSSIPKYDLEQIGSRKGLLKEVVMLIGTRQRAKLRQLEDTECQNLSYLELWRQQWMLEGGVKMSGFELRARLVELQKRPGVSARLKRCLVKKVTTLEEIESQTPKMFDEEEFTNISDRSCVFVNMDPNIVEIAVKSVGRFESKVRHFDQSIGGPLGLPVVKHIPSIKDTGRIRFHRSLSQGCNSLKLRVGGAKDLETFVCTVEGCQRSFHNYNNYRIHEVLHRPEEFNLDKTNKSNIHKTQNIKVTNGKMDPLIVNGLIDTGEKLENNSEKVNEECDYLTDMPVLSGSSLFHTQQDISDSFNKENNICCSKLSNSCSTTTSSNSNLLIEHSEPSVEQYFPQSCSKVSSTEESIQNKSDDVNQKRLEKSVPDQVVVAL